MRRHLYRYRYLLLGSIVVAVFGLSASGYLTGMSSIDRSSGGLADWPHYGRDQEGTRYAPLDQINRDNVAYLEIAWEYHTGDFSDGSDGRPKTTFQATPILVDGVLYLATVYGRVIALDPETGAEIWTYSPGIDPTVKRGEFANRGVTYWHAADGVQGRACERRIFVATIDARLIALDAARGTRCADFGQAGQATPMSYRVRENGRQFVVIAAGGHGRLGTDIGDSVVAFALPERGAGVLAQTVARTLRGVGVVFVLLLACLLVFRYAQKHWLWYALLAILIFIATWVGWLVSQAITVSLLAMFAAVAIAWLLTLGRRRLYAR